MSRNTGKPFRQMVAKRPTLGLDRCLVCDEVLRGGQVLNPAGDTHTCCT